MDNFSEESLVEKPALDELENLGWRIKKGSSLIRPDKSQVILFSEFSKAIKKLNPWASTHQIQEAFQELTNYRSSTFLLEENREKYFLIRKGINVTVKDKFERTTTRTLRLIDFNEPDNNEFLAVSQLTIFGRVINYQRTPDVICFVNGIPLIFMEFKHNSKKPREGYEDNYLKCLDEIYHLFFFNAFCVFSNGDESKIGTVGSSWENFHEWKRLSEDEDGDTDITTLIKGVCEKTNFLDLLENFILYSDSDLGFFKILAKNHQFLGVNKAIQSYAQREQNKGKLGTFWHTQGSGKSYSMLFFIEKVLRKFSGNPTFLILTDRKELDEQIHNTFAACGVLTDKNCSVETKEELAEKLKGTPRYLFSLIQKFGKPKEGTTLKPIELKNEVIIVADEAHRSQYGGLFENIQKLLPDAIKIGFTGTPLLVGDVTTIDQFGHYVSRYDFLRAKQDGVTVPLLYENHALPFGELNNPEMDEKIRNLVESNTEDVFEQEEVTRETRTIKQLWMKEDRLRANAKDFVEHYSELIDVGKAMFVCLNKLSCVLMHKYVQEYWQEKVKDLKKELQIAPFLEQDKLQKRIEFMEKTKMYVVISEDVGDETKFKEEGLDIKPHREAMRKEKLDKRFKDKNDNFNVVFVCAMWLTGFDVKCLSFLYLDKPLKAHTLMQAIARPNRISEGKTYGLIVDYNNIIKHLKDALETYTGEDSRRVLPIVDKKEAFQNFLKFLQEIEIFLQSHKISLVEIVYCEDANQKRRLINDAKEKLLEKKKIRREFGRLYRGFLSIGNLIVEKELTDIERRKRSCIINIYQNLRKPRDHNKHADLIREVHKIIDEYVTLGEINESSRIAIDEINLNNLCDVVNKSGRQNHIFYTVSVAIGKEINETLMRNPSWISYQEEYQRIIDDWNNALTKEAKEQAFRELMEMCEKLKSEKGRANREGFENEYELIVWHILCMHKKDHSDEDRLVLKELSKELYRDVQKKIATTHNWKGKPSTKSVVKNTIRRKLFSDGPQSWTEKDIDQLLEKLFEWFLNN
ncbi:hypothetical protein A6V39_01770 [Candidatus Mycoplasma haematobovis]|uniref:Type I restriction enzyme endonuclease subunit n=1 Tax=Candidatus Mycoplasma haematobovis TaxID=432608 RepID=A0A1A9QFI3_9MOLU|nr:type I restriction endonuclease subunit R [Candidatus Mycoplasma haematobovis]OAL10771.1 hypothetical protein A6V39_01770 [Candidatus Mycoplasma haematobovis]